MFSKIWLCCWMFRTAKDEKSREEKRIDELNKKMETLTRQLKDGQDEIKILKRATKHSAVETQVCQENNPMVQSYIQLWDKFVTLSNFSPKNSWTIFLFAQGKESEIADFRFDPYKFVKKS